MDARRRWGFILIVVGAVSLVAAGVVAMFARDLTRLTMVATVISLPLVVFGFGVTLVAASPPAVLEGVAERLRSEVLAGREDFLRRVQGTEWDQDPADLRFTPPEGGELPERVEAMLVHWVPVGVGDEAGGTLASAAAYYRSTRAKANGRLLIAGAGGAGKTVLASRLAADLCDDSRPGGRVPVWLSLTGCDIDPGARDADLEQLLDAWMVGQLRAVYGVPGRAGRALLQDGRILPVLDGLDEIGPSQARTVIRALNQGHRGPVVITCRTANYEGVGDVGQDTVAAPILVDAAHVIVRPLGPDEIADYLGDLVGPQDQARWKNVLDAVRTGHPVAGVLGNPLLLSFAYRTYREAGDPGELLTLTRDTALAALARPAIRATVRASPAAREHGWDPARVVAWLENLATHQHRHARGSEYDIFLPDLWRLGGKAARWALPASLAAAAAALGISVAAAGRLTTPLLPLGGILLLVAWGSASLRFGIKRVSPPRDSSGWLRVVGSGLGVGLAVVLGSGLEVGLGVGRRVSLGVGLAVLMVGLVFFLVFGPADGLGGGLAGTVTAARNCGELARQCISYSLVAGLGLGLVGGLVFGLLFGLGAGLGGGLAGGLAGGLVDGNGSAWVRYRVGAVAASRRGLMPRTLSTFLDWGLEAGIFRMSGYMLQFRHRDFYQALLAAGADAAHTTDTAHSAENQ